ncbi:MAG: PAS domain S-box protein [Verrucomicrobia bacterium]|nr:PAS domain S-box protein [Verrucomicrobiota bacterium]
MKKPRRNHASGTPQAADFRLRAETLASEHALRLPDNLAAPSPEESRRALHELSVHQIELEMQNEELRRTQAELTASQKRYFALYDLAPMAYCTVSESGSILEANHSATTLLGLSRSRLVMRPLSRFILGEDQDLYHLHCQAPIVPGVPNTCELRMVKADGTVFWAHLTTTVAPDSLGTPASLVVIGDITVRRKIEETQLFLLQCGYTARDEDFFQSLAQYLGERLGMEYVCIDQLTATGLEARTVAIYHDGSFDANVSYALQDTPCGRVVGQTICCFPRDVCGLFPKDKVLRDLQAESYVGTTLWSFDGKPIGLIALIGRQPLTNSGLAESILKLVGMRAAGELERRQAEDELGRIQLRLEDTVEERTRELSNSNRSLLAEIENRLRSERDLAQSEAKFRMIADFTYDWEYWKAPEGKLLYISPSCERITGRGAAEFMADPDLLHRIIHPDDLPHYLRHHLGRELLPGSPSDAIQFRVVRPDGTIRWCSHVCQAVVDARGNYLGRRGSNRDITNSIRLEQELARQRDELTQLARVTMLGEMSGALSHELNQPLTAILSNAQAALHLLAKDPPDLVELREILSDIVAEAGQAGGIIRQVYLLMKDGSTPQQTFEVNKVVLEVLNLVRTDLARHDVTVATELGLGLGAVWGDRVLFQQVLLNLVMNACDAMADNGVQERRLTVRTCRIDAAGVADAAGLRIEVSDTGNGLPAGGAAQAFKRFFTTKPHGLGLGLSVCQTIITAHGGTLGAENNPSCGATFHCTLPVGRDSNQ